MGLQEFLITERKHKAKDYFDIYEGQYLVKTTLLKPAKKTVVIRNGIEKTVKYPKGATFLVFSGDRSFLFEQFSKFEAEDLIFSENMNYAISGEYFLCNPEEFFVNELVSREDEFENNSLLWKDDSKLGIAYFCPHCKTFQCNGSGNCTKCGKEIDWKHKEEYSGKVYWD